MVDDLASPGLTLRIGPPARARDDAMIALLDDATRALGPNAVLALVPEHLARTRLRQALFRRNPGGLLLPRVATLDEIVRDASPARAPLGAGARRALLAELLDPREWPSRNLPGLVRALDHFFRALARQKIWEAEHLDAAIRRYREGTTPRRRDVAIVALYARYRAHVAPHGAPFATTLEETAALLAEPAGLARALGPTAIAVVDGFDELPPLHGDLLLAITRAVGRTVVFAESAGDPNEHALVRSLAAASPVVRAENGPDDPLGRLALDLVTGRTDRLPPAPLAPVATRLTCTAYADPNEEVRAIARAIVTRWQLTEGPADPTEVAVAFAGIERYLPLVRDLFPRFGIPFHETDGVPLASVPPVSLALEITDAVAGGSEKAPIQAFLSSPYVDLTPFDAARPDALGADGHARIRAALAPLAALLETPGTADAFTGALAEVLDAFGVWTRAASLGPDDAASTRDARARERFDARLEEMRATLATLDDPPRLPLALWADRLRVLLDEDRVRPMEEDRGGVPVVELAALRHTGARFAYAGGLTEDAVPRPPRRELFYPERHDPDRDFLVHPDPVREDGMALAGAIARHEETHLSWPQRIGGDDALPSPIVERLGDLVRMPAPAIQAPYVTPAERIESAARAFSANPSDPALPALLDDAATAAPARAVLHGIRVTELRAAEVPSPYTGFLDDAWSGSDAATARGPGGDHVHTTTQLDAYGTCPFQYLAKFVLGLREKEPDEEPFQAKERGIVIHEILERFVKARLASGEEPPIDPERAAEHRRELLSIGREVLAPHRERRNDLLGAAEIDGFLSGLDEEARGRERTGPLAAFLDIELGRAAEGWRPERTEWKFGKERAHSIDSSRGSVRLRGTVDRMDVRLTPKRAERHVLDYKTGEPPEAMEAKRGYRFQLPVYLNACREARGGDAWNALYYTTKPRKAGPACGLRRTNQPALAGSDLARELSRLADRLGSVTRAMAGGAFPLTVMPELAAPCARCHYRPLCGTDPSRWRARRRALGDAPDIYLPDVDDAASEDAP